MPHSRPATRFFLAALLAGTLAAALALGAAAQTTTTGQIVGTVLDPSHAAVPNAAIKATNLATGATRIGATNHAGSYSLTLLPPGSYLVTVTAPGFKTASSQGVTVQVATATTLNVALQIGAANQEVTVEAAAIALQTQQATNGSTTTRATIVGLPLTNRNYTQILGLDPGVASAVPDAAQLGKNNVDVNVNGGRVMDNSYEMDGQDVSNLETQGTTNVVSIGGISVPSPDAIQEFKVQTSLYDAAYGRGSGANVDVITKSGTDQFHGDLFEFNRNTVFNANDFFLNSTGQPRADMKQNQFGGTLGGPIVHHKAFFFLSYQGTRQIDGEGAGSLSSVILPALTADRSPAALGAAFCGQKGKNGGKAVACDGSNINPIALKLLDYKLPGGQYFVPTPQSIEPSGAGLSVFSLPSTYDEDQYMVNLDYALSSKQQISERLFWARAPELENFTTGNVPGSGVTGNFKNTNLALKDSYVASANFLNELSAGYHSTYGDIETNTPVTATDLGLTPPCNNPIMPTISVQGSFTLGGSGNDQQHTESQTYAVQDQISWVHGNHTVRAGFGWEHVANPTADPGVTRGSISFLSFPDFLLGMSAAQNGSAFSNLYSSSGSCGNTYHSYRVSDENSYVQDDYKPTRNLTLDLGLRWEIFGAVSDATGNTVNFFPVAADPGAAPTLAGMIVASNYTGSLPAGVVRNSNPTDAANPTSWKNLGPRLGFSWQPFGWQKMVLRGGFGVYFSRTSVNDAFHLFSNPPFYDSVSNSGALNAGATFQVPYSSPPPGFASYPVWTPYSDTTTHSMTMVDRNFHAPEAQQYSLNMQYSLAKNTVLQLGYVGTRGENLELTESYNQALLASATSPVNGITTNTVQNARQRVPFLGFSPTGLSLWTESANSLYNAFQAMLHGRISSNLNLQVSYTYGKAMTDITGSGTFPNGGSVYNNNRDPRNDWGPADFDTRQRVVANFVWQLPGRATGSGLADIVGGWAASGVVVLQSGPPITFTDSRAGNIYGTANQLAQLCPNVNPGDIETPGPVTSRLTDFFNANAFCAPPAVGNGYGYGNAGRGIVYGPGQHNLDLALMKEVPVPGPGEGSHLQLRVEFYNALNTPQFASTTAVEGATSPSVVGSLNFGQITAMSVEPRLVQLGIKYIF
ncbi:MAG: carboxypeptidase regulatory-like domain-containing protein [Terriglobales bacterium]